MPDNTSEHTNLKTQYAAQVATDLDNNAKEQERIGSDIAALQSQLGELERDHALLVNMQEALTTDSGGTAGAATRGAAGTPTKARLPRARRPKDTTSERGARGHKGGRAGKDARQAGVDQPAKSARSVQQRATRKRVPGAPTLREVVSALLAGHDEPRSAAEVTAALAKTYPERDAGPTVVRNTLEALVAKGQAHRSKQQKSVFYSAVNTTPAVRSAQGTEGAAAAGTTAGEPSESTGV